MAKMTAKQMRFCDEYIIDLNATQAAIRAGYSEKTATVIGAENLTKPYIKEFIEKRLAEKNDALIAKQDEIMQYLTAVMRRELCEHVVVTVKKKRSYYAPDENGTMRKVTEEDEVAEVVEIPAKLSDSNKAAELLGRRYGLYTEENEKAAKLEKLKAETARIKGEDPGGEEQSDGFIEALQSEAQSVWEE